MDSTIKPAWAWAAAASAIAFAAATWLAHRDAPPPDREALAALASRVDALAREVDALRTAPAPRAGPLRPAQTHPAGDSRFRPRAAAPAGPTRADLQASHARERLDPAWGPATEQRLTQVGRTEAILAIDADPPSAQHIQCRSSTCRLEFEFASGADATDWTVAYLTGIGSGLSQAQYFTDDLPGGRVRVTIYGHK
ncbi:hypothetical protein [Lysobacter sp. A3-1-A15]|uniref:hypothetical protein n=1 Tax=Novilysobacter viscosus TaxID=3098602 RepID=UPI002ED86011